MKSTEARISLHGKFNELFRNVETRPRVHDLPPFVHRKGRKGFYYYERQDYRVRLPDIADPGFERAYQRARYGDIGAPRDRNKEVIRGSGFKAGEAVPYFNSLEQSARARAKSLGREYTLPRLWTLEAYMAQGGKCAASGKVMRRPRDKMDPYGPSLDRIDSSKGYTPENCRMVLLAVNYAKSHFPEDDFIEICAAVAKRARNLKRRER